MQRRLSIIRKKAIFNFCDCCEYVQFHVPEIIRICTRVEKKENLLAEKQLFNLLVMELARDDKLLETNKMMLFQYDARKGVEDNPVDWDNLGA
ncbi:UMP-CMP kinase [Hordeum vulgare]|nr:UMP-CMP kinase [Hordeum vulgare]